MQLKEKQISLLFGERGSTKENAEREYVVWVSSERQEAILKETEQYIVGKIPEYRRKYPTHSDYRDMMTMMLIDAVAHLVKDELHSIEMTNAFDTLENSLALFDSILYKS